MNLQQQLGEWYPLLSPLFETDWMNKLGRRIGAAENVVPAQDHCFRAFTLCPPDKVKVVIIGQDPYINGEADGLAFSSFGKMTPSLEAVFDEINRTHTCKRTQTHLDDWAVQGVLLLNSVLTTRMGKSKAHEGWGWESFIKEVIQAVYKLPQPIVFLLWGRDAKDVVVKAIGKGTIGNQKAGLFTHHPQAQNYNPANKFVGCNHFVEANLFLMKHGVSPIWWSDRKFMGHHSYTELITNLQKHMRDAKIDFPEVVYSYPTVPDQPHPFDNRLERGHHDALPF